MPVNPMRTPEAVERYASDSVKRDTGFRASTIAYLWTKYNAWNGSAEGTFGGHLPRPASVEECAYHFYCIFVLIHKHPKQCWMSQFKSRDGAFALSKRARYEKVHPMAAAFAGIIDEVDRTRRLDRYNHGIPPFEYLVTGLVDTFPVYVPQPHRWSMARLLFQPKYKATVLKYQLGISWNGEIILFTGPHLGTSADVTIWEATWADHPFFDWELWLGDLGYQGAEGILVKHKKDGGWPLTDRQIWFNNVHEHERNRAEQIVSAIKSQHRMYQKGVYRGSFHLLDSLVMITAHATAYEIRECPRFPTYGPWDHVYE